MLYKYRFLLYLFFLIILLILAGVVVFVVLKPKALVMPDFKEETLCLVGGNSLMAVNYPYIPCMATYGVIIEPDTLERLCPIVECESGFNPKICSYAGCGSGMGLCQIIPGTLRYCEKKLGKKLDPFNPKDNLECGVWLLENEGDSHWNQSKKCWEERK